MGAACHAQVAGRFPAGCGPGANLVLVGRPIANVIGGARERRVE
jgi:hypothetical protein